MNLAATVNVTTQTSSEPTVNQQSAGGDSSANSVSFQGELSVASNSNKSTGSSQDSSSLGVSKNNLVTSNYGSSSQSAAVPNGESGSAKAKFAVLTPDMLVIGTLGKQSSASEVLKFKNIQNASNAAESQTNSASNLPPTSVDFPISPLFGIVTNFGSKGSSSNKTGSGAPPISTSPALPTTSEKTSQHESQLTGVSLLGELPGMSQIATLLPTNPGDIIVAKAQKESSGAISVSLGTLKVDPKANLVTKSLDAQLSAISLPNPDLVGLNPSESTVLNAVQYAGVKSALDFSGALVNFQVSQTTVNALSHLIGTVGMRVGSNMTVDLIVNPPALGPITAHVALDAKGLSVNLSAVNAQTVDMLGKHLGGLGNELAAATGLRTQVDLGGSGLAQDFSNWQSHQGGTNQSEPVPAIQELVERVLPTLEITGYHVLDVHL